MNEISFFGEAYSSEFVKLLVSYHQEEEDMGSVKVAIDQPCGFKASPFWVVTPSISAIQCLVSTNEVSLSS